MKMKHIIALCLVFALVLPSTALAATAPNASFTASPTSGYAPLKVSFKYTGGTTGITSKLWNFGDGTTCKTCLKPNHIYQKAGTYKVTLTIKTAAGSSTKSRYIYVKSR
jgi:PKD repeat protein